MYPWLDWNSLSCWVDQTGLECMEICLPFVLGLKVCVITPRQSNVDFYFIGELLETLWPVDGLSLPIFRMPHSVSL